MFLKLTACSDCTKHGQKHVPEAVLLTQLIYGNVLHVSPTRRSCLQVIARLCERVDDIPRGPACLSNQYPIPVSIPTPLHSIYRAPWQSIVSCKTLAYSTNRLPYCHPHYRAYRDLATARIWNATPATCSLKFKSYWLIYLPTAFT